MDRENLLPEFFLVRAGGCCRRQRGQIAAQDCAVMLIAYKWRHGLANYRQVQQDLAAKFRIPSAGEFAHRAIAIGGMTRAALDNKKLPAIGMWVVSAGFDPRRSLGDTTGDDTLHLPNPDVVGVDVAVDDIGIAAELAQIFA